MTRLRMDERRVLDTLIEAGVARSRSHALAWCVRLVAERQDDWLKDLRDALKKVQEVRRRGADELGSRPGTGAQVPRPEAPTFEAWPNGDMGFAVD